MPALARRQLLAALLASGCLPSWAKGADEALAPFFTLSAWLVGRDWLPPTQGAILYAALRAQDPGISAQCQALLAVIAQRNLAPTQVQQVLDQERSPLAALPRRIARAWLQGIVGSGAQAQCLAYDTALNAQMVASVLRPPSYAYGAYGTWQAAPADA